MAIVRFFTGFEGGEDIYPFLSSNRVVFLDDGNAPTGQWSLYCNGPGNDTGSGFATFQSFAPIGEVDGNFANARMRCRFVIERNIPDNDDVTICGFGEQPDQISGALLIRTDGHIAARAGEEIGTYGSAVLAIDTEYIGEVNVNVIDNAGDADITVSCSVYTSAGVLIETVTAIELGNASTAYQIYSCSVGHLELNSCDYFIRFDDVIYVVEDSGPATLPTGNRVTRIDPVSINFNTGWDAEYLPVTAIPIDTTDNIESASTDGRITFNHASDLGISNVNGIQLYALAKVDTNDNGWFALNTNLYSVNLITTYPSEPYTQQVWGDISDADFETLTIGFKNKNTRTVNLAQLYAEVLHSGTNYWPAQFAGVDSWKHKVITWIGDGDYQAITGVGFKSQLILAKKSAGTNSSGLIKFGFMGGSSAKSNSAVTRDSRGIMQITDDGFILGPSSAVNQNGIEYTAVCIQDGGFNFTDETDNDCKYFRMGAFLGDTSDNRNIPVITGWNSALAYVTGNVTGWRADMLADSMVQLNASAGVADLIQGFSSGNFQVGTLMDVRDVIYYWFAYAPGSDVTIVRPYFDYGYNVLPDTVISVLAEPNFVIAKQIARAVDAQWRQADIQIGLNSNLFGDSSTNTTGITALGVTDFTIGTTLSQPGSLLGYLSFSPEGEIEEGNIVLVSDAGPNQSVNAFTVVTLAGSGTNTDYPCAAVPLTYLWSKVSGPGVATFVDATDPLTNVNFSASGVYVLRLTVSNEFESATDDVQITVVNAAPVVNAGPDQTILIGNTIITAGTATDDGLPIPPAALTILWTKLSGPGSVSFLDNSDPTTVVTFSAAGIYILQLSAFDGEKTTTDTMTVTILADCALPSPDPTFDCE